MNREDLDRLEIIKAAKKLGMVWPRDAAASIAPQPPAAPLSEGVKFNAWPEAYPDGMTEQDVKNELHDYRHMLNEVPKVYDHVTGGLLTKPNYFASVVIGEADNHLNKLVEEAVADAAEDASPSSQPTDEATDAGRLAGIRDELDQFDSYCVSQHINGESPSLEAYRILVRCIAARLATPPENAAGREGQS